MIFILTSKSQFHLGNFMQILLLLIYINDFFNEIDFNLI